jgi:lambda family phage portal protein
MRAGLAAAVGRVGHVRRFDAAASGRRWQGSQTFSSQVNAELAAAAGPVRQRALYYARNSAWASNGVAAICTATVGSGIRPSSRASDPAVRAAIQDRFEQWTYEADLDGVTDYYGIQQVAVRSMVESGEAFLRLLQTPSGLRLQAFDPSMCPTDETRELGDGRRIIMGIEYSAQGERVAYWLHRERPEAPSFSSDLLRVPAAEVVHLFQPLMAGQCRGVSWLASTLLRLHETDLTEDALIVKQKIAALLCGFVVDPSGNAAGFTGEPTSTAGVQNIALEPGTMRVLPAGVDVKFSEPAQVGDALGFLKHELHAISAGMGVPAHLVSNDVSSANYSSLRASLLEFHARVEQWQFSIIVPQLCRKVWTAWILSELLAGRLDGDVADLMAVDFIPAAIPWIDPSADAEAAEKMLALGLTSRRKLVESFGYDIEELDREIADDQTRARALGLDFNAGSTSSAPEVGRPRPRGVPNAA